MTYLPPSLRAESGTRRLFDAPVEGMRVRRRRDRMWCRGCGPLTGRKPRALVWGAHGGAGTSTLAAWLHPACDMGSMRPGLYPRYPAWVANGRPVVVACGTTAAATRAATTAVTAVTRAGALVCVLAVVSDGWPEPATVSARLRLVGPQVSAMVRVPFVPGLRLVDDPAAAPLARQARRAVEQIRAAAGLPALPLVPDLPDRS